MNGMSPFQIRQLGWITGLICLLAAGCGEIPPPPTPTPTEPMAVSPDEPEGIILRCPEEKTLFTLWFSHLAVLDIDAGDGETFYLEFENIPPSYFDLWINADGTVSNQGIFREAPIGYHGTAHHPNSDDCPVQTFDGVTQMKATITGTCANATVRIHILEEWIDPSLNSDCGSGIGPGPGMSSGI